MAISIGQQLGSYEILGLLGKGGMGEVYRARDGKLNREVAIKILPDEFSSDRERVSRFTREAQSIAALNHSNIAAIYELTESQTTRFLVLELVEGETLAERLHRGPLTIGETFSVAKQILEALEAAYEKGIVHRDLKPANIKITPDGKVKVLDFGLAKAREEAASNVALSNSPTLSLAATNPGLILGTAGYMSPEQAKGFAADHRSDLFSFGCVLYEMLTGRQTFGGDTISEILASVLKSEADFSLLPPKLNPRVSELLHRCLQKNPKNRWHAAADLRVELESCMNAAITAPQVHATSNRLGWKHAVAIVAGALLSAAAGGVAVWRTTPLAPRNVSRFAIVMPQAPQANFSNRVLSISPDGTQIVYQSNQRLFLRSISELEAKPIPGAEDTIAMTGPTFSPDGRSIAYWSVAAGSLKSISTSGGTPLTLARIDPLGNIGTSWGTDGIVFGQGYRAIERVSENGGQPKVLLSAGDRSVAFPKVLPDGKGILFSQATTNNNVRVMVQSLDSDKSIVVLEQSRDIWPNLVDAHYVPSGHLLYAQGGTLFAVAFDLSKLKVTGSAVPVIAGVRRASTGELNIAFSDTGTLVYIPGPLTSASQYDLALADRNGAAQLLQLPPRPYQTPRISPDGKRVAFGIDDGNEANVWIYDFSRAGAPNRLTFGGKNRFPVWSPDGQWIAFQSDRDGDVSIFRQRADGAGVAERLTKAEKGISHAPESWSPKGDILLFRATQGDSHTVWSFSFNDQKVTAFGGIQSNDPPNSAFSPDGRWVAYHTLEPGKNTDEVYVQPFPATGARYQLPISRDNHHPVWSRDGKELFYIPGPGEFASISVTTTPSFTFGNPTPVRQVLENYAPSVPRHYDVTPDGKLIGLMPSEQSQAGAPAANLINVVLNWFDELKQKVPTGN